MKAFSYLFFPSQLLETVQKTYEIDKEQLQKKLTTATEELTKSRTATGFQQGVCKNCSSLQKEKEELQKEKGQAHNMFSRTLKLRFFFTKDRSFVLFVTGEVLYSITAVSDQGS